jgi:hypothetical protein
VQREGGGVFSIPVTAKSAYYLDSDLFAHKTGQPVAKKKLTRGAVIFGVHIKGDPTHPDFPAPGTYESEFNHYDQLPDGRILWTLKKAPAPEDRIDAEWEGDPEIPHGPLSDAVLRRLQRLKNDLVKNGTIVFTTIPKDQKNIQEAQDNMLKYRCSDADLRSVNNFMRFDPNNAESPFIREFYTKLAREMAKEIGVPHWETMEVYSIRYVNEPATEFHIDRRGLGPGVMVGVLNSTSPYPLVVARIKSGLRPTGVTNKTQKIKKKLHEHTLPSARNLHAL